MIPKRIIQTHRSISAAPPRDRRCMERVGMLHPDWDIRFFSDNDCLDFIRSRCPQYTSLYEWYPRPVMRADFFRILAVHQLGGFYLDTDMWLNEPLDGARDNPAVFPWERRMTLPEFERKFPLHKRGKEKYLQVGNYAFGAVEGSGFLADVLRGMVERTRQIRREFCTDDDVLRATGPDLLTSIKYNHHEHSPDIRMLHGDARLEVPFPGTPPGPWFRFGRYGTHLMSGIWRERK